MRPARPIAVTILVTVVAALLVSGCGSDSDDQNEREDAVDLPAAKESLRQAAERFADAIDSGDCERINDLNPVSSPGLRTRARCEFLTSRLDKKRSGVEEFDGAGVIDYQFGATGTTALAILDADRRYHVSFIDSLLPGESVGTRLADRFDSVADEAVEALRSSDCEDLRPLLHHRLGIGTLDRKRLCDYVSKNPIASLFDAYPQAELTELGANGDYAFYGLASAAVHFTVVMARQEDPRPLPGQLSPLPKDASEYALVGVVRTYPAPRDDR